MLRKRRGQGKAPLQFNHATVRQLFLDYSYGRLSDEEEAAIEIHVRNCDKCRSEDMRHLATERMHAISQRPKIRRKGDARPLVTLLCVMLGIVVGTAGYVLYSGYTHGAFHGLAHRNGAAPPAPTPTFAPQQNGPAAPTALKPGPTIGKTGIVTIAWSPNGAELAAGMNPDPASGDLGGVAIYGPHGHVTKLPGFEGFAAPGTIAWSADGAYVAAAGHLTLFVWNAATGAQVARINLPQATGTTLTVLDIQAKSATSAIPASAFAATGFLQWGAHGAVTQAPANAAGPTNIPAANSPIIALWSGQQGTRIFRDANNIAQIGTNDADAQAHAALLRWSPDNHYLLWGYPRVPATSAILGATSKATPLDHSGQGAVAAPNPAFAALVDAVGQAGDPNASVIVWPDRTGTQLAVYNGGASAPDFAILDAATGATAHTIALTPPATVMLNLLSWQSPNPVALALATGAAPVAEWTAGK